MVRAESGRRSGSVIIPRKCHSVSGCLSDPHGRRSPKAVFSTLCPHKFIIISYAFFLFENSSDLEKRGGVLAILVIGEQGRLSIRRLVDFSRHRDYGVWMLVTDGGVSLCVVSPAIRAWVGVNEVMTTCSVKELPVVCRLQEHYSCTALLPFIIFV